MTETGDLRERIAALEVKIEHLEGQLDNVSTKVGEMHDLLMKARGAQWLVIVVVGFVAGLAGFLTKYLPAFTAAPRP